MAFYLARKEAIDFSLTVGAATPSTMCSDVYKQGDDRLGACEAAGPFGWAESYVAKQRGQPLEVPFDYYRKKHHDFSVWYWLFGVPLVLTSLAYAWVWVREGFVEDRDIGRPHL